METLVDGKVSVWIKIGATPKSELTQIWEAVGYGPYPYSLSRLIIDCSTWQSATSSVRYYTTDGGKLISEKNHSPWEFKDIVPGTVGNHLANLICKININKNNAAPSPSVEEQVAQAKNNNSYLVHWENNDPAAWDEAVRQDEILRNDPKWIEKSYEARFKEVVRRVRAIMPEASKPKKR
jgi:hypothetical protein